MSSDAMTEVEVEPERFRVPREARLHWSMLNPMTADRVLPPPMDRQPTFHLFWARNALFHGLRILGVRAGETILVPAYHCASLVEPLLHHGAKVRFYRVDRECRPDLEDIERKIEQGARALLVIHYFGFPQPMQGLRELCDRHGLFLIEDCAHVLVGSERGRALGSTGDIAAFSWRKFLPIYDGGQLVVNNPRLTPAVEFVSAPVLLRARMWKHVLDRKMAESSWNVTGLARLFKRVSRLGRWLGERGRPGALAVNNYRLEFDPASVGLAMSGSSRLILRNTDLAALAERRRSNYRRLLEGLSDLPYVSPLFGDLPEGVCPWVFPLMVDGKVDFHHLLRARGIPAVTWGEVIHPSLSLAEFPEAGFLYANLVFLPVHQSLSAVELEWIVEAVRDAVSGGA